MLIDQVIDPEIFGGYPQSWSWIELQVEEIKPNMTLEPPPTGWGCCTGFNASTLLQGKLTISTRFQLTVIRLATPDTIEIYESGQAVAINPGDTFFRSNSTRDHLTTGEGDPVQYVTTVMGPELSCHSSVQLPVAGHRIPLYVSAFLDRDMDSGPFRMTLAYFELQPLATITLDVQDLPAQLLLLDQGSVRFTKADPSSADFGETAAKTNSNLNLNLLFEGLHNLENTRDNLATMYFLRIDHAA